MILSLTVYHADMVQLLFINLKQAWNTDLDLTKGNYGDFMVKQGNIG